MVEKNKNTRTLIRVLKTEPLFRIIIFIDFFMKDNFRFLYTKNSLFCFVKFQMKKNIY
jgi:hypothetical protein